MNRIVINFSHDRENDTRIQYSFDENGSHLEASFTSEDPDYGTDNLEFNSEPVESLNTMAKDWLEEISEYLDKTGDGIRRPGEASKELEMCYGEYSNSTLFAVEEALRMIVGEQKTAVTETVKKRCPMCGHDLFVVSAHVVQDWVVDDTGDFVSVSADCVEVTHRPDDSDIWECEHCGFSAEGTAFNVKEAK